MPQFDYCVFMIESSPKCTSDRLEKLQERALKYIDNRSNLGQDLGKVCTEYNQLNYGGGNISVV